VSKIAKTRAAVLQEVSLECKRVDATRASDPPASASFWHTLLSEEVGEVAREIAAMESPARRRKPRPKNYRRELIHVATVAVRTIQAFDRQRLARKPERKT
jgi:hypothetical protein